jgi:hypothetical protein
VSDIKTCRPSRLYRPNTSQTVLMSPDDHQEDWGKQLGRHSDTEVLGRFIQRLRMVTEEWLGERIYLTLGTSPHLPLLDDETLEAAFDLAGITRLKNYKVWYPDRLVPHRISGVAELGFGICEHWKDIYECEKEDHTLARKQTLVITFTNISLTVSNTAVVGPHHFEEFKGPVYREMGFQQWTNDPSDATFWAKIKDAIKNVNVSVEPPDLLVLLGEAASNHRFVEVVAEALKEIDLFHLYEEWQSVEGDPLCLAAQGAAKLAKVWQGSTFGCQEPCYYHPDERPEDDGEGVTLREMFESRFQPGQTCRIGECHFI